MSKEIVLVMGFNAGGKTTLVNEFTDQGYLRMNRDSVGGTLDQLAAKARAAISDGREKIVLDNTYLTVESRKSIIAVGDDLGVPVRCVWLATSFEDAQLNACLRQCKMTGDVLTPEQFKSKPYKNNPNLFPPVALFSAKKRFEKPKQEEGFFVIEKRLFVRRWDDDHTNGAYLFDYDDTLRRSTGDKVWPEDPSEVEVLPGRKEKLDELKAAGHLLLGVSNQSAISKGLPEAKAIACFERTNKLLGHDIEYRFCPHSVPPVNCYCRKPHPGIGAYFICKHKLLPEMCTMVGDQTSDKTFAKRCGFNYVDAEEFFS